MQLFGFSGPEEIWVDEGYEERPIRMLLAFPKTNL
jgi:hypothetical protein